MAVFQSLRRCRHGFGVAVFCLFGALAGTPAQAQTRTEARASDDLTVEYKFVYLALGFGTVTLRAQMDGDWYWASSRLETGGLASIFFKSRYTVLGVGQVDGARRVLPSRYDSDYEGRGTFKKISVLFDETGLPGPIAALPTYGERQFKYPVTDEQKRNTVDPMSAWVHFLVGSSATEEAPCGTNVPIYDGRRRYDLRVKYRGEDKIKIKGGKIYKGKTYRCDVRYVPVAGYREKDMDVDAIDIPPFEAWVAPIETPSGKTVLVPVRVEADAPVGTVKLKTQRLDFKPFDNPLLFSKQAVKAQMNGG